VCAVVALAGVCAVPLARWSGGGGGWARWTLTPRHTILVAFVPYLAALFFLHRTGAPRWAILAIGAGCGLLLFIPPTIGSHDIYSYLLYGKMLARDHVNPLVTSPAALGHDPWLRLVLWKHTPSVYGPLWSYATAGVVAATGARLGPSLYIVKGLSVAGVAAAAILLPRLVRGDDRERDFVAAALVWNPLVLFSVAGEGHVDGALLGLIVAGLYCYRRERLPLAAAFLLSASLITIYCLVFVLFFVIDVIRKRDVRVWAATASLSAIAVGAYLPLWRGMRTLSALAAVGAHFTPTLPNVLRDLVEDGLESGGVRPSIANAAGLNGARVASLVALAVAVAWLAWRRADRPIEWRWAMAFGAYVLTAPWFLPWHAIPYVGLGLLAGAGGRRSALGWSALALSATSLIGVALVRFGAPILAFVSGYVRDRRAAAHVAVAG